MESNADRDESFADFQKAPTSKDQRSQEEGIKAADGEKAEEEEMAGSEDNKAADSHELYGSEDD